MTTPDQVVNTTRLLGVLCDADVIDVAARTEHLDVHGQSVDVVQAHVLVSGVDGAARIARTARLTAELAESVGSVVWRTWAGWVDLGRYDVLLSIRVTTTQVISSMTRSAHAARWEQSPDGVV